MLKAHIIFLPGKTRQQWALAEATAYEKKTCLDQNILTYFWQGITAASGTCSGTSEAALRPVNGHMA